MHRQCRGTGHGCVREERRGNLSGPAVSDEDEGIGLQQRERCFHLGVVAPIGQPDESRIACIHYDQRTYDDAGHVARRPCRPETEKCRQDYEGGRYQPNVGHSDTDELEGNGDESNHEAGSDPLAGARKFQSTRNYEIAEQDQKGDHTPS